MAKTFEETMRDALETALQKGTAVDSVTIDGTTVRWRDRDELRREWQFWDRKVARQKGTLPVAAQMDLRNAF